MERVKRWLISHQDGMLVTVAVIIFFLATWLDKPIAIPYEEEEMRQGIIQEVTEIVTETEEATEVVTVEPMEDVTVAEPEEAYKLYDVPLSEELQMFIIDECYKHNIAPEIVIAMIEFESRYKADIIGDNGDSFGLMQIQPKWHQQRMERLGCTDLLNPFQNVTVGIDILAELIKENADVYWVLMSYNSGTNNATRWLNEGVYTNYATGVVARASELGRD